MIFKRFVLILIACQFSQAYALEILNADGCSEKIGNGGNYISESNGRLSGKCQGNAIAPKLERDAVVFAVPAEKPLVGKFSNTRKAMMNSASVADNKQVNDRVELTFANPKIKFGKSYEINFKLKVFPDSDITNESFYLLQIWQAPQYSPIFGLRMKRGSSDQAAFMIRNPQNSIAGKNLVNVKLSPQWKKFKVNFQITSDMQGKIIIFENNKEILNWTGAMGYPENSNAEPNFRLKFGVYKYQEPSKNFRIAYKDINFKEITSSFD
ncbi:heparin lyase I family protein [Acinetobacter sp. ANC 3882]|uniref:heparin lyase I family protein n=1 Tax=Acinetobacter sp. ANC 3882 TaxID=2923423 RepID=UPI001F4BC665|nr:heparin lyase I family protein [Acinetobacter sp. ANC 3882]MCH7315727.1 heparin lyase I family protein [Acinetobacter sp. ANC 3882]